MRYPGGVFRYTNGIELSMPLQPPQAFKLYLPDREIQKNTVHRLVVPVDTETLHFIGTASNKRVSFMCRWLIGVVWVGAVIRAVQKQRYISCTSGMGSLPGILMSCVTSSFRVHATNPVIPPIAEAIICFSVGKGGRKSYMPGVAPVIPTTRGWPPEGAEGCKRLLTRT